MHSNILLHGSTNPLPETQHLRAGQLELLYEAGFLRYIKVGDTEVLRMINHYIRDQNWTTIPMVITYEKIERSKAGFIIVYKANCLQGDVQFQWNCSITGREDSSITFEIRGEALTTFKRNRLGFTVLHPIDTASGKPCTIIHPGDRQETLKFPESVSPHQPFFDMSAMRWKPSEGIEAELQFEGELFETEDQRNWSDASFKTYCTPLSIPMPVLVKKGDVVNQTIHFKVRADAAVIRGNVKRQLTFSVDKKNTTAFPLVGIPLNDLSHDPQTRDKIKELNIDFLRIELYSNDTKTTTRIKQALEMDLPLEIVIFFEKEFDAEFISRLLPLHDRVKYIIVLPTYANCTDKGLLERVVPLLRKNFPQCKIGGGTDAFFTELNRDRTEASSLDFLSFSINPQIHATDIATLTENLAAQKDVVTSCRLFAKEKDIHVGPVTFKMRWNPGAATREVEKSAPGILPNSVDLRQLSLYGAVWTLGSFKYLAENDVKAVTYYETCGWKGLVPHPEQSWPSDILFPQRAVYPLFIILKEILQRKQCRVAKLISSDPLIVDGLALLDRDGNEIIMLANYSDSSQSVVLPPSSKSVTSRTLHGDNVLETMMKGQGSTTLRVQVKDQIVLPPFSFTVLE